MAAVALDSVTVVRDGIEVLRDMSLQVGEAELVAIVGPSGSGKTTVLRLIAGLEHPTAGTVLFDGHDVDGMPTAERDVAMVFQDSVLYPFLTAGKNIGFPLELRKIPKSEVAKRVVSEARALAFERFMDCLPAELSAGHQQLVQVARAMVRRPEVFLMDEPLSRLDPKHRSQLRGELRALQTGYAVTTIYVTNDPVEAMAVADRIVVLGEGQVQQVGSPLDIYQRPKHRAIAELFATTPLSMLGAAVERSGTGYRLSGSGWELLATNDELDGVVGDEVLVGVRAEDIVVDPVGPVTAVVGAVRRRGAFDEVDLEIGGSYVVLRSEPPSPAASERVRVRLLRSHVFRASSGDVVCHIDTG